MESHGLVLSSIKPAHSYLKQYFLLLSVGEKKVLKNTDVAHKKKSNSPCKILPSPWLSKRVTAVDCVYCSFWRMLRALQLKLAGPNVERSGVGIPSAQLISSLPLPTQGYGGHCLRIRLPRTKQHCFGFVVLSRAVMKEQFHREGFHWEGNLLG